MRRIVLALALALALPSSAAAAGDPRRPSQWNLDQIEADAAHATTTGAGAVIAVVDSGVQADHPDLAARLLPGHGAPRSPAVSASGSRAGATASGAGSGACRRA